MAGIQYIAHCTNCHHENRAFGYGVTAPLVCPECHRKTLVIDHVDDPLDCLPHPKGSNGDRAMYPLRQNEHRHYY